MRCVEVPALDHPGVDGREVDLAEALEHRAVLAQHVEHGAALVGDPPQRGDWSRRGSRSWLQGLLVLDAEADSLVDGLRDRRVGRAAPCRPAGRPTRRRAPVRRLRARARRSSGPGARVRARRHPAPARRASADRHRPCPSRGCRCRAAAASRPQAAATTAARTSRQRHEVAPLHAGRAQVEPPCVTPWRREVVGHQRPAVHRRMGRGAQRVGQPQHHDLRPGAASAATRCSEASRAIGVGGARLGAHVLGERGARDHPRAVDVHGGHVDQALHLGLAPSASTSRSVASTVAPRAAAGSRAATTSFSPARCTTASTPSQAARAPHRRR